MNLDLVFGALADPTRRAILSRLALGDVTVGDLAQPFDMSLPAVSKHLRVLESAGLIRKDRVAQSRHCSIEPKTLKAVDGWLESYRRLWTESFDRLDDYLKVLQAAPKPRTKKSTKEKTDGRKRK